MPEPPEPTALYRLYDVAGHLLYIGISKDPEARFKQHVQNQNWWHLVARKDIAWLASREAALNAESEAVREEKPRFDATHRFGSGWRKHPQRTKYDDSGDVAALKAALEGDIASGALQPGAYLKAGATGERYGFSMRTAHSALWELAGQGMLTMGSKIFYVR